MGVYITGDCHGDLTKIINFIERMQLNQNDKIIILGDAGILWRKDKKDFKENLIFWQTYSNGVHLYFLDGNHENFSLLQKLPIDENNMGILDKTIHYLRRGYTYEFEGRTFLICGGADSIDKSRRIEGLSWWNAERIAQSDIDRVPAGYYDYVLTHCCPTSVFKNNRAFLCTLAIDDTNVEFHKSEDRLEELKQKITFFKWFFAHYHTDIHLDNQFTCLFNTFERII